MARTAAKDHDEKRVAMRKMAATFFAEHGYDRASMTDLARACGVSKGLIYHYYASKEDLLADIIEAHLIELREALVGGPETGEARLRWLIRTILLTYRGKDAEHQLQINNLAVLPEPKQALIRAVQRGIVSDVSAALCDARPGLFDDDEKRLRAVSMSLFGMVNWFYLWHRDGRDVRREDYAEMVADMVLGGLGA
ncbi:MAG: TetR/AcrR family transcriptional regulator [Pikeienuella sp.]